MITVDDEKRLRHQAVASLRKAIEQREDVFFNGYLSDAIHDISNYVTAQVLNHLEHNKIGAQS